MVTKIPWLVFLIRQLRKLRSTQMGRFLPTVTQVSGRARLTIKVSWALSLPEW